MQWVIAVVDEVPPAWGGDMRPGLILVGGCPASGKTTLGTMLAEALRLPLVSRDAMKEALLDHLGGTDDRAQSRAIGAASFRLLPLAVERILAAGVSVIVDCNFSAGVAEPEWTPFVERTRMVQIFCQAPPDECRRRFIARARSGARHPGHHDSSDEAIADCEAGLTSGRYRPLDLGVPTLIVDTSARYTPDLAAIHSFVATVMNTRL